MKSNIHDVKAPLDEPTSGDKVLERTGSTRRTGTSCADYDSDLEIALDQLWSIVRHGRKELGTLRCVAAMLRDDSTDDALCVRSVDIHESIDATLAEIGPQLLEGIEVRRTYQDVPLIDADVEMLEHVLSNVLLNAVQALEKDGAIGISTRVSHEHVCVEVRDSGCGICEEHLPHIFDPFFTTRPDSDGVGLGLPLSRTIIHRHGGHIDVSSRVGEFTEVRIFLPVTASNERGRVTH